MGTLNKSADMATMLHLLVVFSAIAAAAAIDIADINARFDRFIAKNPHLQFKMKIMSDLEKIDRDVTGVLDLDAEREPNPAFYGPNMGGGPMFDLNVKNLTVTNPDPNIQFDITKDEHGISDFVKRQWSTGAGQPCECIDNLFKPCSKSSDCPQQCPMNWNNLIQDKEPVGKTDVWTGML